MKRVWLPTKGATGGKNDGYDHIALESNDGSGFLLISSDDKSHDISDEREDGREWSSSLAFPINSPNC